MSIGESLGNFLTQVGRERGRKAAFEVFALLVPGSEEGAALGSADLAEAMFFYGQPEKADEPKTITFIGDDYDGARHNKIRIIKAIRAVSHLGLKEARDLTWLAIGQHGDNDPDPDCATWVTVKLHPEVTFGVAVDRLEGVGLRILEDF